MIFWCLAAIILTGFSSGYIFYNIGKSSNVLEKYYNRIRIDFDLYNRRREKYTYDVEHENVKEE